MGQAARLSAVQRHGVVSVYLFTQVQVDGPDWSAGLWVLVILQDVRLPAQPSTSQHEPTPLPRLKRANDDYIMTATKITDIG